MSHQQKFDFCDTTITIRMQKFSTEFLHCGKRTKFNEFFCVISCLGRGLRSPCVSSYEKKSTSEQLVEFHGISHFSFTEGVVASNYPEDR